MVRAVRVGFALLLLGSAVPALAVTAEGVAAGQRIYREGILPSGQPLRATVGNDVALSGRNAACVNCHRRSGYGGPEGQRVVPPITAAHLFGGGVNHSLSSESMPYDEATLKRAVRDGVHFSGRTLSAFMPRFTLTDSEFAQLAAYLKTLDANASPGVTESEIHFATIVTEGVSAAQRQAFLGVMQAFIEKQNTERLTPLKKNRRLPFDHSRVYRPPQQWRLHVWELKGDADSWPSQMDRYYREQPVFAVLGGLGRDSWQPIHVHCERRQLPCLFPNIEQVEPREGDFYSIYFTRGVGQEAEVLAQTLRARRAAPHRIVQFYRARQAGQYAALALREALKNTPEFVFEDYIWPDDKRERAKVWQALQTTKPEVVVLWLRADDLAQLPTPSGALQYVSATLLDTGAFAVPMRLRPGTSVLWLRELPSAWQDRQLRLAAWLESNALTVSDTRIQNDTYHMLTLVSRVITHLRQNLSRDYLIERIEHLAQSSAWSSSYPRFSLGPGQRVASAGGFSVPLREDGTFSAEAEWIAPGDSVGLK